jgi:chemotaxis protein MotB
MLEVNLAEREAEFQQKVAEHTQMITQLKSDIDSENMEKNAIQERLQTELERSENDYQERLKQLALQKEEEIRTLQTKASTYEQMTQTLRQQIESKEIEISQFKEQLTVKIVDKIVFSSGRATINADGRKVLDTVGEFLKQNLEGHQIQVNGHTDSVPIGRSMQDKFPTNWELSTARAVNVARYLQENADIPPDKLSAVGNGQYHPIADNDTPEGRALNRRIEIILIPELPVSE